uniref:Uncharacterized protein n=1 Tax=Lepeophtheirus salmonis TaxID=72036 RepID=A0A0K2U6F2_LEPSM
MTSEKSRNVDIHIFHRGPIDARANNITERIVSSEELGENVTRIDSLISTIGFYSILSILIIDTPFLGVGEDFVGLSYFLKSLLCAWRLVLVRMELHRQSTIRFF